NRCSIVDHRQYRRFNLFGSDVTDDHNMVETPHFISGGFAAWRNTECELVTIKRMGNAEGLFYLEAVFCRQPVHPQTSARTLQLQRDFIATSIADCCAIRVVRINR